LKPTREEIYGNAKKLVRSGYVSKLVPGLNAAYHEPLALLLSSRCEPLADASATRKLLINIAKGCKGKTTVAGLSPEVLLDLLNRAELLEGSERRKK